MGKRSHIIFQSAKWSAFVLVIVVALSIATTTNAQSKRSYELIVTEGAVAVDDHVRKHVYETIKTLDVNGMVSMDAHRFKMRLDGAIVPTSLLNALNQIEGVTFQFVNASQFRDGNAMPWTEAGMTKEEWIDAHPDQYDRMNGSMQEE